MKSLVRFFSFESMVTAAVTILAALTVTLLALPVIALADEAGGTYMTFVRSASESRLPDGNVVRVMHYFQAGTSESAGNPFEGKNSECIGRMVGKPAGPFNTGSGFCFVQDAAGNGGLWSWRIEEAGTQKCPTVCGTFKWLEGFGNTASVKANGTWRQVHTSKDGATGTYKLTYKR